jgi:methanogenic corrinoid protein MtbC1
MTFVAQVTNSTGWTNARQRRNATAGATTTQPEENASQTEDFIAPRRRSALLNRFVEAEILPRLALARANATASATVATTIIGAMAQSSSSGATTEQDTAELVRLLLGRADGVARSFVDTLEQRGATPTSLYLGVITDAARRLGELWEEDRADFALVTIGLGRLQQIVRALSPSFQSAGVGRSAHADTVLLLPAPGEQHTLGLVILSEFFQREGWHLLGGPVATARDAADIVRDTWVDVAGFSLGSINHVDILTACIRAVRKASRNRYLPVMVRGPLFLQRPELATRVGADSTAEDAPTAVRQARGYLAMRAAAD